MSQYSFHDINLSEKSELETCKNNVIYYGEEEIVLPKKLQRLDIQNETIKKITIPKDSCVKILCISGNMKEIELSDGYKIVVDENEIILSPSISKEERFNLLTTDWKSIEDGDNINLNKKIKKSLGKCANLHKKSLAKCVKIFKSRLIFV